MLQRIGRYEILERIAAGGQGTVYRARDTVLDRVVAVKVIDQPVTDDPQYLEALQREARLASSLDHPNVTTVYDFQVEGDTAFIVMEYVPDSLDKHVQAGQPLPYQRAVEIAIQVARALQHAHDNGVVHRDIKPQNILLTEDGTVKVSDFGIARALASSTRSRTASIMGTPSYMAPEQWASGSLDGRLDQYALGIVLYEMLTGTPPFQGESMEALFVHHRESPVPPIPRRLGVPRAVGNVVRRAMAKSPEDRFANAEGMAAALETALTGAASREQRPAQTPTGEAPVATPPEPPPPLEQEPQPVEPAVTAIPAAPPPVPPRQSAPAVVSGGPGGGTPRWLMFGFLAAVVALVVAVVAVVGGNNPPEVPLVIEKEVVRVVTKEVPVEVIREILVDKEVPVEVIREVTVVKEGRTTTIIEKDAGKQTVKSPSVANVPTSTPRATDTPQPTPNPTPFSTPTPTPRPTPTRVPTPAVWRIEWEDVKFSSEIWMEIVNSSACSPGPCLRSGTIPDGSRTTMRIELYHEMDPRHLPFMDAGKVLFEVKGDTETYKDILTLRIGGQVVDQWSGSFDWIIVEYLIPGKRPLNLEWEYEKDDSGKSNADAVWLRNISMRPVAPGVSPTPHPLPTRAPIPTLTPQPIAQLLRWQNMEFTGSAWQEISRSVHCSLGPCLRSGDIPDGGFSTMLLKLYPPGDPRHLPFMNGNLVSFEVKGSTEACCDILSFRTGITVAEQWSGSFDWDAVVYRIPSQRPILLEWRYLKNGSDSMGEDAVWLRNIFVK